MFKPIKFLFKLIGFLILIITILPLIALGFMYKGYSAPVEDFQGNESISFTSIAENRLDSFLADENADNFDFTFSKEQTNSALKAIYAKDNPNFGSTDTTIPENQRKYAVLFGEYGGFKGVTTNLYESGLTVEAGVEVGFSGIYYQTTVFLDLGVDVKQVKINEEDKTEVKLNIKNISLGNLPILWMYDFADWASSNFIDGGITGLLTNMLPNFGKFDLKNKAFHINTEDLINLLSSEDENKVMIEALLGFVDQENLLLSGFSKDNAGISLALGKMRSSKTGYELTSHITNDTELQQMLTGQLTSLLISSLSQENTLKYNIHEHSFNQLLEYYVKDSMNITQEIELGDSVYTMTTKPLFAKFINDNVHFTIIMELAKQGDTTNVFKTDFTLVATPSISEDKKDLVFTLQSINIGDEIQLPSDKVSLILSLIGENEMIEGNQIILKDFLGEFSAQGVTVTDVNVNGAYLVFDLQPSAANLTVLTALQGAINGTLTTVLADEVYSDVEAAYNDFLLDPTNTNPDTILNAINELPVADQEALFSALQASLGSIPGLENLIP